MFKIKKKWQCFSEKEYYIKFDNQWQTNLPKKKKKKTPAILPNKYLNTANSN